MVWRLPRLTARVIWIVADGDRARRAASAAAFFAPERERVELPAFDCLPYDRFSPSLPISSDRASALARLTSATAPIVIASLASVMQKVPPPDLLKKQNLTLEKGGAISFTALSQFLDRTGYQHMESAAAAGHYAIHGGIIDVYPAGSLAPARIDFFGDAIEDMRSFDPETQRSLAPISAITLLPASELILDDAAIRHFQSGYAAQFGFASADDRLYAAISEGQRISGIEHWLPLFYPKLKSIFDYCHQARIVLDESVLSLTADRWTAITTCYEGRVADGQPALPPEAFYIDQKALENYLKPSEVITLSPFASAGAKDLRRQAGARFCRGAQRQPERFDGRGQSAYRGEQKNMSVLRRITPFNPSG